VQPCRADLRDCLRGLVWARSLPWRKGGSRQHGMEAHTRCESTWGEKEFTLACVHDFCTCSRGSGVGGHTSPVISSAPAVAQGRPPSARYGGVYDVRSTWGEKEPMLACVHDVSTCCRSGPSWRGPVLSRRCAPVLPLPCAPGLPLRAPCCGDDSDILACLLPRAGLPSAACPRDDFDETTDGIQALFSGFFGSGFFRHAFRQRFFSRCR
jgi:hypothetical protein